MSAPSIRTVPSTRVPGMMSFIRFSVRRNVLLPQPDGPMNAVTTFGWMRIEMSCERALLAVVEVQPLDLDLRRRVGVGCWSLAARRDVGRASGADESRRRS